MSSFAGKTAAASYLGPSEFGYVALFLATTIVVNQLAEGGITRGAIQLIAAARGRHGADALLARRLARASLTFGLLGLGLAAIVAAVVLALPSGREPRSVLTACGIVTGGILALIATERAITQGLERFRLTALTLCLAPACTVISIFALRGTHTGARALNVAFAYLVPAVIVAVLFGAITWRWSIGAKPSPPDYALVARFGGIFTLAAIFEGIGGQSDVLFLSWLRPVAEVGVYGAAAAFASVVPLLSNTINTYFGPRLTAVAASGDESRLRLLYIDSVALMSFVGLMGLGGIFGVLPVVLPLLLGPRYAAAVALFPWLLPSIAILVIHATSGAVFMAKQRNDLIVKIALALVGVTLVSHSLLVAAFGPRGAALGMLSGQVASIVISWLQIRRLLRIAPPIRIVVLMLVYATLTAVLLRAIGATAPASSTSFIVQAIFGAISFFIGWRLFHLNHRLHRE